MTGSMTSAYSDQSLWSSSVTERYFLMSPFMNTASGQTRLASDRDMPECSPLALAG